MSLELNVIETNQFFLQKEGFNWIMLRYKIETQLDCKYQKWGSSPWNLPSMPKYGSTHPWNRIYYSQLWSISEIWQHSQTAHFTMTSSSHLHTTISNVCPIFPHTITILHVCSANIDNISVWKTVFQIFHTLKLSTKFKIRPHSSCLTLCII